MRVSLTTETARLEAFSDGVFAIAITLLILEIKVPSSDTAGLAAELARQWPSYLAFFISFAFIGIMWINHHGMFTHIKRCVRCRRTRNMNRGAERRTHESPSD